MNLNEAIKHLEESLADSNHDWGCDECKAEHEQLLEWLEDYRKMLEAKKETVEHPNHYQGKHECIDVMRALFGDEAVKGFCKCNAYKYRFRSDKKNGENDIKKAEWYEDYLIKMEGEKDA